MADGIRELVGEAGVDDETHPLGVAKVQPPLAMRVRACSSVPRSMRRERKRLLGSS